MIGVYGFLLIAVPVAVVAAAIAVGVAWVRSYLRDG